MIDDHIGKLLIRAIGTIDPRYKSILTGYYYNQLSIPDLTKINNASSGYIYKVLTGARQSLREYLRERWKNLKLQERNKT